jgi:hypothetical protein
MPESERPAKPGYRTSEFWISVAAVIVGSVVASGAIPSDGAWERIVGLLVAGFAALGYTGARLTLKKP